MATLEQTDIKREIDNNGVIVNQEIEQKIISTKKGDPEPDYVKLYIKAWCAFKDLKGVNTAFLTQLLPYMSYATASQHIYLNTTLKRLIAAQMNWSEKTALQRFNTEIGKLAKTGVIKKVNRDTYSVNPELIGKGTWSQIKTFKVLFNIKGDNAGEVQPEME